MQYADGVEIAEGDRAIANVGGKSHPGIVGGILSSGEIAFDYLERGAGFSQIKTALIESHDLVRVEDVKLSIEGEAPPAAPPAEPEMPPAEPAP